MRCTVNANYVFNRNLIMLGSYVCTYEMPFEWMLNFVLVSLVLFVLIVIY